MKNLNAVFVMLLMVLFTACNTDNDTIKDVENNVDVSDNKIYNVLYEVDSKETMVDKYGKTIDRLFMKLPKNELLVGKITPSIVKESVIYKNSYWASQSWHFENFIYSNHIAELTKVEDGICYIRTKHNSSLVKLKVHTNYKLIKDGKYKIVITTDNSINEQEKSVLNSIKNKILDYKFSTEINNETCKLEGYNIKDLGSYFYITSLTDTNLLKTIFH